MQRFGYKYPPIFPQETNGQQNKEIRLGKNGRDFAVLRR
jgi:hypothetical protein